MAVYAFGSLHLTKTCKSLVRLQCNLQTIHVLLQVLVYFL